MECGADVVRDDCTIGEYGDPLDNMGNSSGHFNAFQKSRLGWLGYASSPPIITAESTGLYELEGLASATGGAKALRIQRNVDPISGAPNWYYLEYRQAIGFDSYLDSSVYGPSVTNGLVFHLGTDGDMRSSYLLDMTPGSLQYDWVDLALPVAVAYTDETAGMTVALEQIDAGRATISVDFGTGGCVRQDPTVSLSSSPGPWVEAGTAVDYGVTVTNNDSGACQAADFDLSSVAPAGWSAELDNTNIQMGPGASGLAGVTVISSATAADGFYDVTVTASHNPAPGYTGSAIATYVVDNAAPPVEDTQAPTVPAGLTAGDTRKQLNLVWDTSSDDVGVAGYRVWRDGVVIASTTDTSYRDRDVASNTPYEYRIDAYDAANNVSEPSDALIASKSGGGGKGRGNNK
jgi:hypothetical protein